MLLVTCDDVNRGFPACFKNVTLWRAIFSGGGKVEVLAETSSFLHVGSSTGIRASKAQHVAKRNRQVVVSIHPTCHAAPIWDLPNSAYKALVLCVQNGVPSQKRRNPIAKASNSKIVGVFVV